MKRIFSSFRYTGFLIVLLFSFWAVAPFFHSGFFPMHDNTQVARVFEMGKSLKDGVFPVRWVDDLGYGYGYPIFNFYAPLAYYFGGIITLLGVNVLLATKIMFVVGILGSGVSMYFLAREFWGELGGILSGLFYLYIPYHAVDIYVRGDVAEFWAYLFIPLIFLGIWKIFVVLHSNKERMLFSRRSLADIWLWVFVGSTAYAGVILSHNLTALMVTPFVFVFTLVLFCLLWRHRHGSIRFSFQLLIIFSVLVFGVLLASFYWLPVLGEMTYTNVLSQVGGGADFRDHFVCLPQLWNSPWGFGGSTKGCIGDGFSFRIGKTHLILVLLAFLTSFFFYRKKKSYSYLIWGSLVGLFISVFLMLDLSRVVWETIHPMAFFQYPWRFLLLVSFFSSFLAGEVIFFFSYLYRNGTFLWLLRYGSFLLILLFMLITYSKLFFPQFYVNLPVSFYMNTSIIQGVTSSISDEYMPKGFMKPTSIKNLPKSLLTNLSGDPQGTVLLRTTQEKQVAVTLSQPQTVVLRIAPFPAWHILVDGRIFPVQSSAIGYLLFLGRGRHLITASFVQTPVEVIGNLLSLAGFLGLLIGIMRFILPRNH